MKFSIFTPTHNLKYIDTPLKSLTEQTNKDFEWVILLNGESIKEADSLTSKLKENNIQHKIITSSMDDLLESKSLGGNEVILYKTDTCPWCKKAKDFLEEKGIKFEERNVQEASHSQELNEKMQKAGKKPGGVPVVDFNGTLLSGFNELTQIFNTNIGALKKKCCETADGEILVELDHDDALTPDCLEELSKAFNEGYDFCFSDDYMVEMKDDKNECIAPYSSEWGWTVEQDEEGNNYHPTFNPSALSFSYIWYAPDHVRAWRKSFYEKIGGHNASLEVCDDYELCCRSYINGKCHRIPKPLYKYFAYPERTSAGIQPDGSQGDKNRKIQELTHSIHDDYILQIAAKWATENSLKKIDLCSGKESPEGFTGVDKESFPNGNIVFDLDQANWPFEDGSVGVFRAWNALSYLKNPVLTMKEIYRCLSDYGWLIVDVVSTDGRGAFQDPNNVSHWNTNSFWYYTKSDFARVINTPVKFQLNRINNFHPSSFHEFHNIIFAKAHLVKLPERGFEIPIHGREI